MDDDAATVPLPPDGAGSDEPGIALPPDEIPLPSEPAGQHDVPEPPPLEDETAAPPEPPALSADLVGSIWDHLGERFGLVAMRPKLKQDVRVRRISEEVELVQISTGKLVQISADDVRFVRMFDGKRTIAEMIVAEMGEGRRLAIEPVLGLLDRVVRASLLENYPPNMFNQLEVHLARISVRASRDRKAPVSNQPVSQFEQVPWRPRTPLLAERAQFLRSVALLRPLDGWTIGALAELAHEETFPAASNIVLEGATADRFFIVKSGEANVVKVDEEGKNRRIARLGPGDYFGETGLLQSAARNATVRAGPSRPVQLYSFDAAAFESTISPHIDAFRGRQVIARRRERLEQIELFTSLSTEELEQLAEVIQEHHHPKSTVIVRQGDEGDRFYLVVEGSVGVVKDGIPVAKLGSGDFFGETALLFTSARTASVITTEDSLLWSIDKKSFQTLVRQTLMRRRDLMPTLLNRLQK